MKKKILITRVNNTTIAKWAKVDGIPHKEGDEYHGFCRWNPDSKQYVIYINKEHSDKVQLDTLLHEYAHVLQFEEPGGAEQWHGHVFQKYYNKLCNKWSECI